MKNRKFDESKYIESKIFFAIIRELNKKIVKFFSVYYDVKYSTSRVLSKVQIFLTSFQFINLILFLNHSFSN